MKRLRCPRRPFTLVELLVAMAVFVVMLGLMLRFFSGTQRVWRGLREHNEVFADARVAMDLIESLLNSSVAIDGFTPLAVNGTVNSIRFLTNSPRALLSENAAETSPLEHIYLVKFELSAAGVIELRVKVTPKSRFTGIAIGKDDFRPSAFDGLSSPDSVDPIPVADRVTELTFRRLVPATVEPEKNRPQAIEITIRMFDTRGNFRTWSDMDAGTAKDDFRLQHEYTFRRIVNFEDVADRIEGDI